MIKKTDDLVEMCELNSVILRYWRCYNWLKLHRQQFHSRKYDEEDSTYNNVNKFMSSYDNTSELVLGASHCQLCRYNYACETCVLNKLTDKDDCQYLNYAAIVASKDLDDLLKHLAEAIERIKRLFKYTRYTLDYKLLSDVAVDNIEDSLRIYEDCDSYGYVLNHIYMANSGWRYTTDEYIDAEKDIINMWREKTGSYIIDKDWFKTMRNILRGDFNE